MPKKKKEKAQRKLAALDQIPPLSDGAYTKLLHDLQVELVKLQRSVIESGARILVLLEGRDAGGKDGTIKRITEHLSPRETRVVALPKPSDREKTEWYFQRWVSHLPAAGEIVLFNRSWYNRAGVERVMGFATEREVDDFLTHAPQFEAMLEQDGIQLMKYYLDISKDEQKRRLKARARDPLKQWKISPIDAAATKNWDAYSVARNEMFARTHTLTSPWSVVRADDKKQARVNLIRHLLARTDYPGADARLTIPNPAIVFGYEEQYLEAGLIAP
jgi:polyphosphate kinase